jgi:hypothetical protein
MSEIGRIEAEMDECQQHMSSCLDNPYVLKLLKDQMERLNVQLNELKASRNEDGNEISENESEEENDNGDGIMGCHGPDVDQRIDREF